MREAVLDLHAKGPSSLDIPFIIICTHPCCKGQVDESAGWKNKQGNVHSISGVRIGHDMKRMCSTSLFFIKCFPFFCPKCTPIMDSWLNVLAETYPGTRNKCLVIHRLYVVGLISAHEKREPTNGDIYAFINLINSGPFHWLAMYHVLPLSFLISFLKRVMTTTMIITRTSIYGMCFFPEKCQEETVYSYEM